jgi:hypothetical protein
VSVTPEELWRDVGKHFRQARLAKGWKFTHVERAGGPTSKTVQAIEAGHAGNVKNLVKCATALDIDFVAVLETVLSAHVTTLSPDASYLVRKFERTTVKGRSVLIGVADALPEEEVTTTPEPAPGAGTPPGPDRSRPGPQGTTRRSGS